MPACLDHISPFLPILRPIAGTLRPAVRAAEPGSEQVRFIEVAKGWGPGSALNSCGHADRKRLLVEEVGVGVAFFDYGHDGWLDILLINGSLSDVSRYGHEPTRYLFHDNRGGTLTDITRDAGLTRAGLGHGCCVGDYDNDGFDDLFRHVPGQEVLYRNNGYRTFENLSDQAGVAGEGRRGALVMTTTLPPGCSAPSAGQTKRDICNADNRDVARADRQFDPLANE